MKYSIKSWFKLLKILILWEINGKIFGIFSSAILFLLININNPFINNLSSSILEK